MNPLAERMCFSQVLIIGDSLSLGAMPDLLKDLAGVATAEHAPFSGDGGALDVKYAMDTDQLQTAAHDGPPWNVPLPASTRYGDGCLNGARLLPQRRLGAAAHHTAPSSRQERTSRPRRSSPRSTT